MSEQSRFDEGQEIYLRGEVGLNGGRHEDGPSFVFPEGIRVRVIFNFGDAYLVEVVGSEKDGELFWHQPVKKI